MSEREIRFGGSYIYVGEFSIEPYEDSWGGINFRVFKGGYYDRLFHSHILNECVSWCKSQPLPKEEAPKQNTHKRCYIQI